MESGVAILYGRFWTIQFTAGKLLLADGQHEAIINEKLWSRVRKKRIETGVKQPSKVGKDSAHLLTGILKCPACGGPMYTNKHAWTNKDGTTLPEDTCFRDRKLYAMTIQLEGLYDIIVELEKKIEDAKLERHSVEMNAIMLDNVYKLMINFLKRKYDK